MINLSDVATGLLGLGLIVGTAVGLVALGGRDPKVDEHDLSDYHEPAPDMPSFSFTLAERGLAQMRDDLAADDECVLVVREGCGVICLRDHEHGAGDILPPAPAGMNAGSPLYAGMLFDTWHPEDPAEVAERWLREIGAEEQDKAGIGPAHDHWVNWDGTCDLGCPGCDRDMTGVFPVVRAA